MKKIVILTGSELRHTFFRVAIASAEGINVEASFCEGLEKSLRVLTDRSPEADIHGVKMEHVLSRDHSEKDFFSGLVNFVADYSKPEFIPKGTINEPKYLEQILKLKPDMLVSYGCSLIRSDMLSEFRGRFLNVHLGLSPYYRGVGTNFWPLVNEEPEYVGATFMHIDKGIDTGEIIHQIRARMFENDDAHDIGNRLILDMVGVYIKIIQQFDMLKPMEPLRVPKKTNFYKRADFTTKAVEVLNQNFRNGLIKDYLRDYQERCLEAPIIQQSHLVVR